MIEPAGTFVKKMDLVLEDLKSLESCFSAATVDKVRDSTEWIVRFALSVSKACPRDDADVFDACRNVVAELEALKVFLGKKNYFATFCNVDNFSVDDRVVHHLNSLIA